MLNDVTQPFFQLRIVKTACADQRVQHRRLCATTVGMSTPAAGRTAFPFRLDDPDFTETGSARLLPAHGSIRLASHPARPESAADCRADGRRPGRGTASAAGRTGPPPGRTARGRSRRTAAGPGIRSARRQHFCH